MIYVTLLVTEEVVEYKPKMFEEGTKEELIAHFKAAAQAYDLILKGKDSEISQLKNSVNALDRAVEGLKNSKGYYVNDEVKSKNADLKRTLSWTKDELYTIIQGIDDGC